MIVRKRNLSFDEKLIDHFRNDYKKLLITMFHFDAKANANAKRIYVSFSFSTTLFVLYFTMASFEELNARKYARILTGEVYRVCNDLKDW